MSLPKVQKHAERAFSFSDFDLSAEELQRILEVGHSRYTSSTPIDPPSCPGTMAYYGVVGELREVLLPKGWKMCDIDNQAKVYNSKRKIRIIISSGNKDTGIQSREPKSNHPKGPKTIGLVQANEEQLLLFPLTEEADGYSTWVFLFYISRNEARCEMSLPSKLDGDGRIAGWKKRLILSEKEIITRKDTTNEYALVPEIEISRKSV